MPFAPTIASLPTRPATARMDMTIHTPTADSLVGHVRHDPYAITRIDGARLNIADEAEAVFRITALAASGHGGTVFTLNLDHLVKLAQDPGFRAAYERATYVTADGAPIILMAREQGVDIHRVTGADLVMPLCRAAAQVGVPVYFFGTTDDSLDRAGQVLKAEIPGLTIAGAEAPAFGFDPSGAEARQSVERIEASGARICFVALGAPKQELFANAAVCRSGSVVYVCVGAALDFLAGTQRRAPAPLRRFGLEWAWRLALNPRRMTKRYVLSGLYLIGYMLRTLRTRLFRGIRAAWSTMSRDVPTPPTGPAA